MSLGKSTIIWKVLIRHPIVITTSACDFFTLADWFCAKITGHRVLS